MKSSSIEKAIEVIRQAGDRYPSTFICRSEVPQFTGGIVTTGTLANLDSKKIGIPNAFRIGRRVCYPIESVVDWLISRLEEGE